MDCSRFARRPGDQVTGQWVSIMGFGIILPFLGCLTSSATMEIYGEALWNPPDIVHKWMDTDYNAKTRAAAFVAGAGSVLCQLAVNVIDNAFSAGMDMAGLLPSYTNIRRGAYIGLVVSIAMYPWQLLANASTFINDLSAYSVFLGPMVGIMCCEYWVLRQQRIELSDLYHPGKDGIYHYWHGFDWRAFVSWVTGLAHLIPGFAHEVTPSVQVPRACTHLYYLAFLLRFAVSFAVHLALNKLSPPAGLGDMDDVDHYGTFTEGEALRLGVAPAGPLDEDIELESVEGKSHAKPGKVVAEEIPVSYP